MATEAAAQAAMAELNGELVGGQRLTVQQFEFCSIRILPAVLERNAGLVIVCFIFII